MIKKITAKRLTTYYFSIVAIAIIIIHYSVFELTTDDIEYSFAKNRLDRTYEFLLTQINENDSDIKHLIDSQNDNLTDFDISPDIYFDSENLPNVFPDIQDIPYNKAIEIMDKKNDKTYFVMKVSLEHASGSRDVLLAIDNWLYELSEDQINLNHAKQILISIFLIFVSLLVIIKISSRLTDPISRFANALTLKNPGDLKPFPIPTKGGTYELEELINKFNDYLDKIGELIDRERSFNRYASHELRSPLMVIKGVISIMSDSDDSALKARQMKRLSRATDDMSEFIETLLSLTATDRENDAVSTEVDEVFIREVVESHTHIITEKTVEWRLGISGVVKLTISKPAFRILLGNIIKNAFSYTETGTIQINLSQTELNITDSGKGYETDRKDFDGYGLGLLLVKDICRRFGYTFSITKNTEMGSTARVIFNSSSVD